jgi:methionyl-tRNA formyltransferase
MRSNAGGALDAVETEHQTDSIIASGMAPDSVFVGGVDVSRACLEALCAQDLAPVLVVGYGPARQAATGVADMEAVAREQGIEYVGADDINAPGLIAGIEALDPAVMFVIGWSQLVRRKLLDIPARGSVGIHPTALPEGRGRAPIPWTIIKGLRRTASTMFYLTEGVDDGDVIGSVDIDVDPHEDAGTLYAKHRDAHVTLMHRHARDVLHGTAPRTPQDHDRATTWERRRPEDGRIDPSRPVSEVGRLVRAVTRPFPGAFLELEGERLLVWRAEPAQGSGAPPGVLDGDLLSCADGALRLLEVERCQLR